MPDLAALVHTTERKWLGILYEHSRDQFNRVHLPSHDHIHHLRVWQFAKEILQTLNAAGISYAPNEIEALIVAVFFHDMGMVVTREKEHGLESRRLCEDFFGHNPGLAIPGLDYVFEMVHKHDAKNYTLASAASQKPALHTILNIADDLDAFGAIGVYRYAEIYTLRNIAIDRMASAVIPNLQGRFNHFRESLSFLGPLVGRHRLRHEYTQRFFRTLGEYCARASPETTGPLKVLNILAEFSLTPELTVEYLLSQPEDRTLDPVAVQFFRDFRQEWNCALATP